MTRSERLDVVQQVASRTERERAERLAEAERNAIEAEQKLVALEKAGKLKRIPFKDRVEMKKLVDPVMASYAKEIGADAIYAKIVALN